MWLSLDAILKFCSDKNSALNCIIGWIQVFSDAFDSNILLYFQDSKYQQPMFPSGFCGNTVTRHSKNKQNNTRAVDIFLKRSFIKCWLFPGVVVWATALHLAVQRGLKGWVRSRILYSYSDHSAALSFRRKLIDSTHQSEPQSLFNVPDDYQPTPQFGSNLLKLQLKCYCC